MTKKEFIRAVTDDNNILKEDASKICEIVFAQMKKQLLLGREVRIDGVGRFSFKFKEAGVVHNNITGTQHNVGPRVKLKFIPFPKMKKLLKDTLLGVKRG